MGPGELPSDQPAPRLQPAEGKPGGAHRERGTLSAQKLTESLIALLEAGTSPWRREWDAAGQGHHVNLFSGRRYRGASPVLLTLDMHLRGSALPFWCGFGEGKTRGLSPRKGSKAVYVMQPQVHVSPAEDATAPAPDGSAPEGVMHSWVTYRPIPVFNAADLVGEALPTLIQTRREAQGVAQRSEPERLATAEEMLAAGRWRWSMAGARLARDLSGVMGSRAYAREELVAELGAVLLGERLEIGSNVANHAAYLASWIALLRDHHGCWWRSLEMRAGPWI